MESECIYCKGNVKTYPYFGKWVCRECIDKRKTGKPGNSGMVYNKKTSTGQMILTNNDGLELVSVKKSNPLFVKWFIEHYPGSKGIPGRQVNYVVYKDGLPIGIIGANSPPLNYKRFNEFFGLDGSAESGKLYLNNNVFRLVKGGKNDATRILKLFRNNTLKDYYQKYGDVLLGLVTFVEPPRTGAIYKADHWENIGLTQGISVRRGGENWYSKSYTKGTKKHIFCYKYKPRDYRREIGFNPNKGVKGENLRRGI